MIFLGAPAITASGVPLAKNSRQLRTPALVKMERLLTLWLQDLESRNFPVSLCIIQEKARRLFDAVKENLDLKTEKEKKQTFKASKGWFHRFQKRRGFRSINLKGEAASAKEFNKIMSDGNYLPCQVWNVDETALYYKVIYPK